jgi:dinuclear metal center YbgI/SA1388 family protein
MARASLTEIVSYCDHLLQTDRFQDWEGAQNGLQVENNGSVTRLAAAVDGTLATVQLAAEARADLLLVHHGLFWGRNRLWTGPRYRLLRALLDHNLAVYSSHLPLDAHPTLGNNALLAVALGMSKRKPFFETKGQLIGYRGTLAVSRDELTARLGKVTGAPPTVLPGGPSICRRVGVVTGGAGDELAQAAAEGVDTFVTGEGRHWTYALAEELGINVFYGGHYATEVFGVRALAEKLSTEFGLPWVFLDHPTGL